MNKIRILAAQTAVSYDAKESMQRVEEALARHRGEGFDLAVLPEMFICPYAGEAFPRCAEEEGGPIWQWLSELAKEYHAYLVAGSVPERADGVIYNTAYVFDREGKQIGKHRKVYLYDVDFANGQYFHESDTIAPGKGHAVFDTEFGRMGVCICYDIRFPELFYKMADDGAQIVFVPASFNMTSGPAHWHLACRSRAVDSQVFVLGCATTRDENLSYVSYGHTLLCDPWGTIVEELDEKSGEFIAEIDLDKAAEIRRQLPLLQHRQVTKKREN